MAKKSKPEVAPEIAATSPAAAAKARNWVFNFGGKGVKNGRRVPPPAWLPYTVLVRDCATEEDARKKLHELIDLYTFNVHAER